MYAFGMLGSYFSQGVYAVAGPFQGAVDIIVVQQEDGSFKSSPWYVKCGDFQGVLTRREKIVDISVNGTPANFYMLLNNRGEAYFEKEVEDAVLALPSTSSSAEGLEQDKQLEDLKSEAVGKGSQAQVFSSTYATGSRQDNSTTGAKSSRQRSTIKQNKDRADDSVSKSASEVQDPLSTGDAEGARQDSSIDQNKDRWVDSVSKSASEMQEPQSIRDAKGARQDSSIGQNKARLDDFVSTSALEFQEPQSSRVAKGAIDQNNTRSEDSVSMSASEAQKPQSTTDAKGASKDTSIEQNKDQSDDALSMSTSEVQEPQGTVNQSSDSFSDQSFSNVVHQYAGLPDAQDPEYVMRNAAGHTDSNQLTSSDYAGLREAHDLEYVTRNAASSSDTNQLTASDHSDSLSLPADDTFGQPEPPKSGLDTKCTVLNVNNEDLVLAEADSILPKHLANEESPQLQWAFQADPDMQTIKDEPLSKVDDELLDTDTSADGVVFGKLNPVITEDWFGLHKAAGSESGDEVISAWNDLERSNDKTMDELIWNDFKIVTAEEENELHEALCTSPVIGVRIDGDSLRPAETEENNHENLDSSVWVSDALVDDTPSDIAAPTLEGNILMQAKNEDPSKGGAASDKNVVCKVEEGLPPEGNKAPEIPTIAVVPPPSRWAMWPLARRKSRTEKAPVPEARDSKQALLAATNIALESPLTAELFRKNGYFELTQKPKLRSYVPTSAQIESLKLKDGANKVTFTFPRVLGRTQVDANIYLWKWKTRIVISDVDGTITKSDVLGQFMPLVGRDWSQTGVTRLFSAVKENGYEVLFLSARAISQSYLTRQFLINLKQDGETLPEGPVFISPDGIIPSLYREVVRRAPHEFKISCLEGIRRLFPNDVNPFYAGFGNRDTDEISYLKVGIPKGKIFIINPRGEVKVNRQVDTKSYTSIYALVDDMFPPLYSSEQEDFNTWNYWKLPIPSFVDEPSSTSTKTKKSGPSKK